MCDTQCRALDIRSLQSIYTRWFIVLRGEITLMEPFNIYINDEKEHVCFLIYINCNGKHSLFL